MKLIYVTILVIVVAAVAFFGYKVYHRIQLQASIGYSVGDAQTDHIGNGEGEISQNGDPCGGTGGNGQIVSTGSKTFIMKRKDDSSSQIIHLTDQETIKTSTGSGSLSDLKTGDSVTLVGGPNSDGSFTANTVVVCK
ncbi:MAG TPA: hypothetical protein VNW29_07020 [Candidatus Sulfotelmatobacter sp.]|jgi:hypothetical protein|nr:hypothetical protein [Candidatus Sulfotelmatobacter sp.]